MRAQRPPSVSGTGAPMLGRDTLLACAVPPRRVDYLFGAVAGLAMSKVIPVNGACIEVGAVDASELGLAVDLDAAAAAHAGAVDHDGVEAGDDGNLVLAAGLGGELHHGNGANAEGVVDGIGLAQACQGQGYYALLAHGAVIRGDVQTGQRQRVELLVQDNQVLGAGTHDDVDVLAPCSHSMRATG